MQCYKFKSYAIMEDDIFGISKLSIFYLCISSFVNLASGNKQLQSLDILNGDIYTNHPFTASTFENTNRLFSIFPPHLGDLQLNTFRVVFINGSIINKYLYLENYTFSLEITAEHKGIALPLNLYDNTDILNSDVISKNKTFGKIVVTIDGDMNAVFIVKALQIGRTKIYIRIIGMDTIYQYDQQLEELPSTDMEYNVTVIRRRRLVDVTFELVVAGTAMLNIFSMGCSLDLSQAKQHIYKPACILIGGCCQFLIMPMVALGLAKLLQLEASIGLGMLYAACVPGGGAGHLMTVIINGNLSLSLASTLISTLLVTGTSPLWIFLLHNFFKVEESTILSLKCLEIWLVANAGIFLLGVILRYIKLSYAEAILNWLSKPMLLLYSILFFTLGMYINLYMFENIETKTLVAAALLPTIVFGVGWILAHFTRQDRDCIKTISTESEALNCMLVLVILRFSLPQPDADITSTVPIWITFMTPLPFVVTIILHRLKRTIGKICSRRKEKYRTFSIASSLLNVTNVTSLSNTTTPMVSPTQEDVMLIEEKITVL